MMNVNQLKILCNHFNLGDLKSSISRVFGGLLNRMWKIETDQGTYAVKELAKQLTPDNPLDAEIYEMSEEAAALFIDKGIPGVKAREASGKYLKIVDNRGFFVYPWVEAKGIGRVTISEKHAYQVPAILAKMHRINLDPLNVPVREYGNYSDDQILELIDLASRYRSPFAADLLRYKHDLFEMRNAWREARPILEAFMVTTHNDLDQKNILWDRTGLPIVIDWESAEKINPTYDILSTSLFWSGVLQEDFQPSLLQDMLELYERAGGTIDSTHLEAAINSTFSWFEWVAYNIELYGKTNDEAAKKQATEQVLEHVYGMLRARSVETRVLKVAD